MKAMLTMTLTTLCLALLLGSCDKKTEPGSSKEAENAQTPNAEPEKPSKDPRLEQALMCHQLNARTLTNEVGLFDVLPELMESCEAGCDAKNQPSCLSLERLMAAFCKVKPESCQKICDAEPTRTIGKLACTPPALPKFMSDDERLAAARCHQTRLELELEKRSLDDAIAAGFAQNCALACDGDDQDACTEAKTLVPTLCEKQAEACTEKCATLPDGTLRSLIGCPALDTPAKKCAHALALAAALSGEALADAQADLGTLCAEACDADPNDKTSCDEAKKALLAICNELPGFCAEQCGLFSSKTSNEIICKFAGLPVPKGK